MKLLQGSDSPSIRDYKKNEDTLKNLEEEMRKDCKDVSSKQKRKTRSECKRRMRKIKGTEKETVSRDTKIDCKEVDTRKDYKEEIMKTKEESRHEYKRTKQNKTRTRK